MTTQQTFDNKRLIGLQKELGSKVLGELIDIFLEETPQRIESAMTAERASEFQNLQQAVHPLKSNAGELGFVTMQQIAQEIESLAGRHETQGLSELLQSLQRTFLEAKKSLLEYKETLAHDPPPGSTSRTNEQLRPLDGNDTACGRQ